MRRNELLILFSFAAAVSLPGITGCGDAPEVAPDKYGTVLSALPVIEAAETPFTFPYDEDGKHQNCKFHPMSGKLVEEEE